MKKIIVCSFLLIIFNGNVFAETKMPNVYTKYVSNLMTELEKNGYPVFYSEYNQYDKQYKEVIQIILIMELGKTKGVMIEQDKSMIINVTNILYSKEKRALLVEETEGGIWSYKRAGDLLKNFSKKKFLLLEPNELKSKLKFNNKN